MANGFLEVRRAETAKPCSDVGGELVRALRTMSGSTLATQTMPWIQAELSILQGEEHTVGAMRELNKLLRQAQQSCHRPVIFSLPPSSVRGNLL